VTADSVFVWGAGKVGRALARALKNGGVPVTVRAARRGLPSKLAADVVLVTVRDGDIAARAGQLADSGLLDGRRAVVLHCAGARAPDELAALRSAHVAVGQLHPLLSFADPRRPPTLQGGAALVAGDARAVVAARRLAKRMGMRPFEAPGLDPALYHAAAALLANGAAALAADAGLVLARAGVAEEKVPEVLAPLLASVADNVAHLGMAEALTGPIRRGDVTTVRAHLERLAAHVPEVLALYRAVARAQLRLAADIGEATAAELDAIERQLRRRI
jgi:predicted short-subunit dehydrogenase-like oxidoreductase (DUF2520 family)